MKKRKKWIKPRHSVVRALAFAVLWPYCKIKYGLTVTPFSQQNGRQYLILFNHQTAFDQFFVGMAFRGPVYYVASEDLFSNGFTSSLIRWLVAPIPIRKQITDIAAVMNCIRVAREGGTIAIAPEGNRTYSGRTEYMNPAIAPLIKKLGLPVAFCRIEGGFGVHPRWSDVLRRGKMRTYVSRVLEPAEYKDLTPDEIYSVVKQELFVDEGNADAVFRSKKSAEYLERAIYVCPECGLSRFESKGDVMRCTRCSLSVRYLPTTELEGLSRPAPFRFVRDWYDYQQDYVNRLDPTDFIKEPAYRDCAKLSEVTLYKKKTVLCRQASLLLYGDRLCIDGTTYHFDDLSAVTVLGKNKLNIYCGNRLLQLKSDKRFNALRYVNFYHRYKNTVKENKDVKFLGL